MSDKLAVPQEAPQRQPQQPPPTKAPPTAQVQTHQHEIVINGHTYRSVNTVTIKYNIQKITTRRDSMLVDRGANGCVGGADIRILTKSLRTVDIEGIDNHQVNNIPIVTGAGIADTQLGPVIVILHQVAYTGRGSSILSSGQMEHFGITVDDKSSTVGGRQCITTPDGFVLPLAIKNGLPYMHIRAPTDKELWHSNIPHVVLTADTDWDPTVLDHTLDMETWINQTPDNTADELDRPFDRLGDLKNSKLMVSFHNTAALNDVLDHLAESDSYFPTDGLCVKFTHALRLDMIGYPATYLHYRLPTLRWMSLT